MHKVIIENLRVFAHHGVMPQENIVGAYFNIDLSISTDFTQAMLNDDLDGTINYAAVYAIVKREMAVTSKLIENVAYRIALAIKTEIPKAQSVFIRITKENPPMGADCKGAGVELEL